MAYTFDGTVFNTTGDYSIQTRKVWDDVPHEEVVNKLFFVTHGLIGPDRGREGDIKVTKPGYPVIKKEQLTKEPGDTITMNLRRALWGGVAAATFYNMGVVDNQELLATEEKLEYYNIKVRLGQSRTAAGIKGKMTLQRGGKGGKGIDMKYDTKDALTDLGARFADYSCFFAYYAGWSPHVIRELGITVCPPTEHPNKLYGLERDAMDEMTATDTVTVEMLSYAQEWCQTNNLNPVRWRGNPYFVLILDPRGIRQLRNDPDFRDDLRGVDRSEMNPLFRWCNCVVESFVVLQSNWIQPVWNWDALTVTTYEISLAAETAGLPTDWLYTDIRQGLILGADSMALAYGSEYELVERKEDDYGNLYGRGIDGIYGARRADWSEDVESDPTIFNQSSAILHYTYNVNAG